jgi:hypothetical protein
MTTGAADADRLPLSAMLSQALVAFTIEFDNEAERRIQHRTSRFGGTRSGVWLVSMVMWLNCMRYVGADPITVGEIARLARSETNLAGLERWDYLKLEPDPAERRPKPPKQGVLAHATGRGIRAQEVWRPLTAVIEQRAVQHGERRPPGSLPSAAGSLRAAGAPSGGWRPAVRSSIAVAAGQGAAGVCHRVRAGGAAVAGDLGEPAARSQSGRRAGARPACARRRVHGEHRDGDRLHRQARPHGDRARPGGRQVEGCQPHPEGRPGQGRLPGPTRLG